MFFISKTCSKWGYLTKFQPSNCDVFVLKVKLIEVQKIWFTTTNDSNPMKSIWGGG